MVAFRALSVLMMKDRRQMPMLFAVMSGNIPEILRIAKRASM
jgi:hypothetical protein